MSQVRIVLLKDVPQLGRTGQIVQVKSGFARNYLIPQKLAAAIESVEAKKALIAIKEQKKEKERQMELKKEKKVQLAKKHQAANERKAQLLKK